MYKRTASFRWIPGSPIFRPEKLLTGSFNFGGLPLFSYARYGFIYALKYLQRGSAKDVLLPSYMCHEVVRSLVDFGYRPRFYPVATNYAIDLPALEKNLSNSKEIVALVVFHPYGRRLSGLGEVESLAKTQKVDLIEDCAHVPFPAKLDSKFSPRVRIYSLRKTFALPYGAVVDFGNENAEFQEFVRNDPTLIKDQDTGRFVKWAATQQAKRMTLSLNVPLKRGYRDLSQDPLKPFALMHAGFDKLLPYSEPERATSIRRENYLAYRTGVEAFSGWAEVTEFDTATDTPYQLPLTLKPGLKPKSVIEFFLKTGIAAVEGIALPHEVIASLDSSHPFLRQVNLPLHQDLSSRDVGRVVEICEELKREILKGTFQ